MKTKMGVVAFDEERQSKEIYKRALNSICEHQDIEFIVAWSNINELMNYIRVEGVPLINSLEKIIVLDEGFPDRRYAKQMVKEFISLQELFNSRGVNYPYLVYATTQQDVYDIFKNNNPVDGHNPLLYNKVRIFRLKTKPDGGFSQGDILNIVTGVVDDTALDITKKIDSNGDILFENLKKVKAEATNGNKDIINQIKEKMKNKEIREELSDKEKQLQETKLQQQKIEEDILKPHENKVVNQMDLIKENLRNNPIEDNEQTQSNLEIPSHDSLEQNDLDKLLNFYKDEKKAHFEFPVYTNSLNSLSDKNKVILFTGRTGSGVTSTIFNFANVLNNIGKKTLIINLDNYDDLIYYFENYKREFDKKDVNNIFEINFLNLDEISVSMKENIDVISNISENQHELNLNEKLYNLQRMLNIGRNLYDYILIDGNNHINEIYDRVSNSLDEIVVCTTLEQLDQLDNFSSSKIKLNDNIIDFILNKNKYPSILIGKLNFKANNKYLINKIHDLDTSLKHSRLIGSILYDEDWNLQQLSKIPYCLQSKNKLNRLIRIFSEIVF